MPHIGLYLTRQSVLFSSVLCRLFINILHTIPVVVVDSRREVDEVKELLGIAKDYVLALRIELKRKDPSLKDEPVRQAELAAYFTHCNLQATHLKLSLQSAMSLCFKLKNYGTAATFARRLLELNLSPQVATRARQVWKSCTSKYAIVFRLFHFIFLSLSWTIHLLSQWCIRSSLI